MSIEERLKDILREKDGYIHKAEAEQLAIAQIIAAFKDEGWLEPNTKRHQYAKAMQKAVSEQSGFKMPYMTGQEWYERFENELGKTDPNTDDYTALLEAARKASGVDN